MRNPFSRANRRADRDSDGNSDRGTNIVAFPVRNSDRNANRKSKPGTFAFDDFAESGAHGNISNITPRSDSGAYRYGWADGYADAISGGERQWYFTHSTNYSFGYHDGYSAGEQERNARRYRH